MTAMLQEENVLITNPFKGGNKSNDKRHTLTECVLRDPREPLPDNWTGFEVITAHDGGRRVSWSRLNFQQITEAKATFEKLIAEGLVPYYIDPKTGQSSEIAMSEFDPGEGAVMFEKSDFNPANVLLAPTRLAAGG